MTIEYLETIRLGCNEGIANLSNQVLLYDYHTMISHNPIVDKIGYPLWEAQRRCDLGIQNGPIHLAVLVPSDCHDKVNPINNYTKYQSLRWFAENIQPPSCGVVFSFYMYDIKDEVNPRYYAGSIWPLNKSRQWIGDGDYITVHNVERSILHKHYGKNTKEHPTQDVIDNIRDHVTCDVKFIDYRLGEELMFETLKHSKLHITYHGGSYWSAGMINIPTICYGKSYGEIEGNYMGERHLIEASAWNSGVGTVATKVHQYDWDTEKAVQKPQSYITHTVDVIEFKEYLRGYKSLKLFNGTYDFME